MTFDLRAAAARPMTPSRSRVRRARLWTAAAVLALACSACSAASSGAPGTTGGGTPDPESARVTGVKLAACLEKQGIKASVGQDGSVQIGGNPTVSPGSADESGPGPDAIDKAYRECTKQVTGAYPTERQVDQTELAWQRKYAACMRSQGLDYPDPNPDGSIEATAVADDGKKVQAAQVVCDKQVPHP